MRLRRTAVALAAAVLLFVSGCGSPAAPKSTAAGTLAFTGTTLDGAAFDAATLAGKPAILWFWAPWCATCASEAQSINDLKDEYGDRLAIAGIAGMGDNRAMHQFVSDLEVTKVPNLDDQKGVLWKRFGITEQSTYILVDKAGRILDKAYLDDLQLTTKVKSLVA
jgi:thiol-disulfide isomerase/thioredoxin